MSPWSVLLLTAGLLGCSRATQRSPAPVQQGLAVVALAILAALVVLEVLPREDLGPYGTRILLLALIVALASIGIAGLVRWGRRG